MALDTEAHKPPLHDQITDMQRKVQRLGEWRRWDSGERLTG